MTQRYKIYQLRVGRLGIMLLPQALRRPVLCRLLLSGLTPLEGIVRRIRRERAWMMEETSLTGQRGRLRGMLNDSFDEEFRRIEVEDTMGTEGATQSLLKHRGAEPGVIVLGRSAAGGLIAGRRGSAKSARWGRDFVVTVPRELESLAKDERLRGLVNRYKLPGTRWVVEVKD